MTTRKDDHTFDAAIVGSGPAGTTAAIHLARHGFRVCLLEKDRHPRYKVCGGGLLARALKWLPVAADEAVEELCHRVEVHFWDKRLSFSAGRDAPIIHMVMRTELDALLLAEAKREGVEVREDTTVSDLAEEGGAVTLTTSGGQISGRFVIAADGVSSIVAQKGGWPANHGAIPSLECEVEVDPPTLARFQASARFDLDHPGRGYSWVFPKRKHLSVGVLTMARSQAGLKASLQTYLERLGIRATAPLKPHGALLPIKPRPGLLAKGRILLVGDAAGLAEPICGEGITNALQSGTLAARALAEGGMDPGRVAPAYQRALEMTILRELEIAGQHARILYGHPQLRNLLFRLKGEEFCNRLIDIMTGERSFASVGGPLRQFVKGRGAPPADLATAT